MIDYEFSWTPPRMWSHHGDTCTIIAIRNKTYENTADLIVTELLGAHIFYYKNKVGSTVLLLQICKQIPDIKISDKSLFRYLR